MCRRSASTADIHTLNRHWQIAGIHNVKDTSYGIRFLGYDTKIMHFLWELHNGLRYHGSRQRKQTHKDEEQIPQHWQTLLCHKNRKKK